MTTTELAGRVGKLTAALEIALEVIDEQPTALDPCHETTVAYVRRVLDEARISAVKR